MQNWNNSFQGMGMGSWHQQQMLQQQQQQQQQQQFMQQQQQMGQHPPSLMSSMVAPPPIGMMQVPVSQALRMPMQSGMPPQVPSGNSPAQPVPPQQQHHQQQQPPPQIPSANAALSPIGLASGGGGGGGSSGSSGGASHHPFARGRAFNAAAAAGAGPPASASSSGSLGLMASPPSAASNVADLSQQHRISGISPPQHLHQQQQQQQPQQQQQQPKHPIESQSPTGSSNYPRGLPLPCTMVRLDPIRKDFNILLDQSSSSGGGGGVSCSTLTPADYAEDPTDEIEFGCYYIWGTVLGNHGVTEGRTYYEVKFANTIDTLAAPFTFSCFRAGWTLAPRFCDWQLPGDSKNAWCYSSFGAVFNEGRMDSDYGVELLPGDILSLLIDIKSMGDGNAKAEFSVEVVTGDGRQPKFYGASQQIFYHCISSDGNSKLAWFPHLALMNCSLDCNFGATPVALDDRMHAGRLVLGKMPARSLQTSEYADPVSSALPPKPELHLTVGLPASGKTYYARNLPYTKRRQLLGMDQLIEMTLLPERGITRNMGQEVHTRDRINYFLFTYGSRIMFMQADEAVAMGCDVVIDQCNVSVYTRAKRARKFVESGYSVALHVVHPSPSVMNEFQNRLVTEFGLRGSETARLQLQANFTLPSQQSDQGVDIQYVRSSRSQLLSGVKKLIAEARQAGYSEHSPDEIDEYFLEHCNKLGISIANPFVPSQRRLANHAEALSARLSSAAEARRIELQQKQNLQQQQQQQHQQNSQPMGSSAAPPASLGNFAMLDSLGLDTSLLKNVLQSVGAGGGSSSASASAAFAASATSLDSRQQQPPVAPAAATAPATSGLSRFLRNATAQQQKQMQQQLAAQNRQPQEQQHQPQQPSSVYKEPAPPPPQQQQQPPPAQASNRFHQSIAPSSAMKDEDLTDNLLDLPMAAAAPTSSLFPAYSPAATAAHESPTQIVERFVELCRRLRDPKDFLLQLPNNLRADLLSVTRRLLGGGMDSPSAPTAIAKQLESQQLPAQQSASSSSGGGGGSSSFSLAAFTRNSQQQQQQQHQQQQHQQKQSRPESPRSRRSSSRRSRSRSPPGASSHRVRRQQQQHQQQQNSHQHRPYRNL